MIADNLGRATAAPQRGPECREIRSIIGAFACGWNTRLPFLSAFSGFEAYRSLLESEGQVGSRRDRSNISRAVKDYDYIFLFSCVILHQAMRFPRVKADCRAYYHCMSRAVHSLSIFRTTGNGSEEAEWFVHLMRGLEAFSGIRVLDYVLMSNRGGPWHRLSSCPARDSNHSGPA